MSRKSAPQASTVPTFSIVPKVCRLSFAPINLFAVVVFVTVIAFMAFMCGITPSDILYDHWPDSDDHPTNRYDVAQHPFAN